MMTMVLLMGPCGTKDFRHKNKYKSKITHGHYVTVRRAGYIDPHVRAIVVNAIIVSVSIIHVNRLTMILLLTQNEETEDHHCIWLNNCIGKRNYRPFFVFITTATLLCLFVIAFSAVHLILIYRDSQDDTSFGAVFNAAPVSFVLAIVCFVLLLMVGGLTLYHCSLILRGITTHEQVKTTPTTMLSLFY